MRPAVLEAITQTSRVTDTTSPGVSVYARNVPLFYVYRALMYFFLWMPIWFIYLQRMRGLTMMQVSLIGGVGWLSSAVAQVPTGAFADILGRRVSLAVGAFAYGVGVFGYALAPTIWLILPCNILWTVGFAFMAGADLALVYDSLKQEGREAEYTKVAGRAASIMHGAQACGSLIGAPLAMVALNLPLLLSAGFAGLAGIVALQLREPPRVGGPAPSNPQRRRYWATIIDAWRILRGNTELRYCTAYYVATALPPFLLAYIFLQPYAGALGVPLAWMGALVFGLRMVSLAGSASAHRVVARAGERFLLYALPIAMVASCLAMAVTRSLAALLWVAAVQLLGAISLPFVTTLLNRQVPSATRATLLSFAFLLNTLGVATSQPLLGAAADRWGIEAMMGIMGVSTAVLAGAVLMLWRPNSASTKSVA